jgi:hypothetical protein
MHGHTQIKFAEKLFGILSAKFRVFSKPVSLHSYRIESVVKCI